VGNGVLRRLQRPATGAIATAALIAGLAAGTPVQSSSGSGAEGDDDLGLEVTVGVGGRSEIGDPVLVRISVTAGEPIDGELLASTEHTNTTWRQPIELAAGTTKLFTLVLPTMWDRPRVTVTVVDDDDEAATATAAAQQGQDELVGLLPRFTARLDEPPARAGLADGVGNALFAPIDATILDLGVSALQTFDTIVGAGDDVLELSDARLADLLRWVSLGGILVLDDAGVDGAGLDRLPAEWRPGTTGVGWAGLGEVHLVAGAAGDGRWADVVPPTPVGPASMFMGGEMSTDPQMDLASRSGVDLPSVAPLAIGIGLYALVIGPGLYLLLRRRRRLTLGWLVIPAAAVLTAGGVAFAGDGIFDEGDPATAVFRQITPGGAYDLATVLTYSSSGGVNELTTPAGWGGLATGYFYYGGLPQPVTLVPDGDGGLTSRMAMESLQASVRTYEGPAPRQELALTAAVDGDRIAGTATNNTGADLHDVAVFAGAGEVVLGDLPPGESVEWDLRAPSNLNPTFQSRGSEAWGDPWADQLERPSAVPVGTMVVAGGDDGGASGSDLVEFGIWGLASMRLDLFPTGMVRVVGWTDDVPSALLSGEVSTRTALSSIVPVTAEGVGAANVRATVPRNPFTGFGGMGDDQVTRYLLPAEADPGAELFLTNVRSDEVAFWDGRAWVEADATLDRIPVPAAAVRRGAVLLRSEVDMNMGQIRIPTLASVEVATDDAEEAEA